MLKFKNINIIFVLLVLFLGYLSTELFYVWFPLLLIFWTIITTIGSFHIRWNYFLPAKHFNYQINKNQVAITFDDGPNVEFTPKVLGILKKHQAKATFFLIGKHIEKYPNIVQQILDDGHLIGNHSYLHNNGFGFLKTKEVIKDISITQRLLKDKFNIENKLFRPPFGVTNPNIAKVVKNLNLQVIGWSVRSLDTKAKTVDEVMQRIIPKIKKGAVILLHDTSTLSVEILEQLLQYLEEHQLQSVTINELFKEK